MLPELAPLLVLDDHDVEALMRSARGDLAKLSLELRAVQHEAASAQSASDADEAAPTIDLDAAHELLRTGVEARLARRRIERRDEIELAQRDAAQRITDAEAEARALVDATRAQLLPALGGTISPPTSLPTPAAPPTPTSLPTPAAPPTPAARRHAPPAVPSAAPSRSIGPDDDPVPDSPWMPAATDDGDWALVTKVVAPSAASALPPMSAPRRPRPSAAADTEVVPLLSAPLRAPTQPAGGPGQTRRSFRWQGLFHVDVLLPLIAVLIVAVVLLAWVA